MISAALFKIKAVIYDMDGLLVDSEPIWEKAAQQVLAQYGIDLVAIRKKYNLVTTGMRLNEIVDLHSKLAPQTVINTKEVTEKIIDVVTEEIILKKPMMPGVIESLELCHSLNLKIGLASSSPMRFIKTVTDSLNISHYFEQRVSAENLKYGKPDPTVYLTAAEKLHEDRLNCLTLEDSVAGMIATKAARMRSIVVPEKTDFDNKHWCIADVKLASLLQLNAQHLI